MKSREELDNLKLSELREYAKEFNIPSVTKYKKDELIQKLLEFQPEVKEVENKEH